MSAAPKPSCKCRICKRDRRILRIKRTKSLPAYWKLIEELWEAVEEAEGNLSYDEAILNGSWPQAVEILTAALERAQGKR